MKFVIIILLLLCIKYSNAQFRRSEVTVIGHITAEIIDIDNVKSIPTKNDTIMGVIKISSNNYLYNVQVNSDDNIIIPINNVNVGTKTISVKKNIITKKEYTSIKIINVENFSPKKEYIIPKIINVESFFPKKEYVNKKIINNENIIPPKKYVGLYSVNILYN